MGIGSGTGLVPSKRTAFFIGIGSGTGLVPSMLRTVARLEVVWLAVQFGANAKATATVAKIAAMYLEFIWLLRESEWAWARLKLEK
jgi:hypothetical protein